MHQLGTAQSNRSATCRTRQRHLQRCPPCARGRVALRLRSIKGRAIVSLNHDSPIRQAFDGFHIETVGVRRTVGGVGEHAHGRWLKPERCNGLPGQVRTAWAIRGHS